MKFLKSDAFPAICVISILVLAVLGARSLFSDSISTDHSDMTRTLIWAGLVFYFVNIGAWFIWMGATEGFERKRQRNLHDVAMYRKHVAAIEASKPVN